MDAVSIAKKGVADLMATGEIESTAYSEMLSDHLVDLSLGLVVVVDAAGADRVRNTWIDPTGLSRGDPLV
jgi:hypothetical protein